MPEQPQRDVLSVPDIISPGLTSSGCAAAKIDKAKQLLDSVVITQAEFDAVKAKALA